MNEKRDLGAPPPPYARAGYDMSGTAEIRSARKVAVLGPAAGRPTTNDNIGDITAREERDRRLLTEAAALFREYQTHHLAKMSGPPLSLEAQGAALARADRNGEIAARIERALASPPPALPDGGPTIDDRPPELVEAIRYCRRELGHASIRDRGEVEVGTDHLALVLDALDDCEGYDGRALMGEGPGEQSTGFRDPENTHFRSFYIPEAGHYLAAITADEIKITPAFKTDDEPETMPPGHRFYRELDDGTSWETAARTAWDNHSPQGAFNMVVGAVGKLLQDSHPPIDIDDRVRAVLDERGLGTIDPGEPTGDSFAGLVLSATDEPGSAKQPPLLFELVDNVLDGLKSAELIFREVGAGLAREAQSVIETLSGELMRVNREYAVERLNGSRKARDLVVQIGGMTNTECDFFDGHAIRTAARSIINGEPATLARLYSVEERDRAMNDLMSWYRDMGPNEARGQVDKIAESLGLKRGF